MNTLFTEIEPLEWVLAENKKGDSKKNRLKSNSVPGTTVSSNFLLDDLNKLIDY